MMKVIKIYYKNKKSFTLLEVLISVAIFSTLVVAFSIVSSCNENKLFCDECEKIRHLVCESIEIAANRKASFSIAVNTIHRGSYSTKAIIIRLKDSRGREKYEYFYFRHAEMETEEECIFDGVSFTMSPALTWRIWKAGNKEIAKTLTISGNGYCTLK